MVSSMCGGNQVRSTKTSVSCLQSSMVVGVSWSGVEVCAGLFFLSHYRKVISTSPTRPFTLNIGLVSRISQYWKIMVVTQNIDTLGPIWTFSLRWVLTFVASGLDINGCVWSYFEGTANVYCYTSCTLTTLQCINVPFLQYCHMKIYKIF